MRFPVLALCLAASSLHAQGVTIEIDHATGRARAIGAGGDITVLGERPQLRVAPGTPIRVRVVNTNTAIYRFRKEVESSATSESEAMRGFLKGRLMPYATDLQGAMQSAIRSRGEASNEMLESSMSQLRQRMTPVRASLTRLDDAVFKADGVQDVLTASVLALEEMRRGKSPEDAAARVRSIAGVPAACQPEKPLRLPSTEALLSALSDLSLSAQDLHSTLSGPPFSDDSRWRALHDSAQATQRVAQAALADFDALVESAYRGERLATIVAHACSHWTAPIEPLTRSTARMVTIRVEPRNEVETARLADRGSDTYEIELQPRSIIRPALGVGAVGVPSAKFANHGVRPVTGGYEVFESGSTDSRFGWAASLGLTWPAFDRRDSHGTAVWLPEIVVAGGGTRGAGVGAAASWNFLKLGAGAMWIHHTRLVGAAPGTFVFDESELRTVEGYGRPRLYVSLSIFDWAPFASRIPQ